MGKLTITGKAERRVNYNGLKLSIRFYAKGKDTTCAVQEMMKQSERFLQLITDAGVNIKDIQIENNYISRNNRYDENYVTASREFVIEVPFDISFINGVMDMVAKENFDADVDFDYQLRNIEEIHDELLKEALENSGNRAEYIAGIMGQKVIGIDNVEYNEKQNRGECERAIGIPCFAREKTLSDALDIPFSIECETVDVCWIIE